MSGTAIEEKAVVVGVEGPGYGAAVDSLPSNVEVRVLGRLHRMYTRKCVVLDSDLTVKPSRDGKIERGREKNG